MANKGAGTNSSQFYFTFKATPHLDRKHTVFGKLVGGEEVLDALEKLPLKDGTERPAKTVKITEIVIYQDPFDDYKKRVAKKLARQSEAAGIENAGKIEKPKKDADDVNWFGVKIGIDGSTAGGAANGASVGVGKYLNLKRSLGSSTTGILEDDDSKKKRKIGFGNFDSW